MTAVARPHARHSQRRAVIAYLVAIVVPTLALCYLGLSSVETERQALERVAAANARQTAERVVDALQSRVSAMAGACLRDRALDGLDLPAESDSPALRRAIRRRFDEVRARHPVAGALFVIRGDDLALPEPWDLPRRLDQLLAGDTPVLRAQFKTLFTEAEALEFTEHRPADALVLYRRASELRVSAEARALALFQGARCSTASNDLEGAVGAYHALLAQFPDEYDLSNQPYGIVAALELDERVSKTGASGRALLAQVTRDLADGRWELSRETAEYFHAALMKRRGLARSRSNGPYLAYLELADRLQHHGRPPGLLDTGEVVPASLGAGAEAGQVFYMRARGAHENPSDLLIGLVVDLEWVSRDLLPATASSLDTALPYRVGLKDDRPDPGRARAGTLQVPFRELFPFWILEYPQLSVRAVGPTLLFAGSTLAVLAVLLLGVILLVRDASREAAVARLRSDFVSGVSHELKTPLTLIRMYGEMLWDDPGAPKDERRGYYGIITRESERLTRLIDRVLDFSRVERGVRRYTLERLDLAKAVRVILGEYDAFLRQRGFVLEPHLDDVALVDADRDAVREAVVNLLDNAVKYSGESRYLAVSVVARPADVVVEVQDRGIGFDDRTRACLFQPFERGEQHTGKGGYGLGLYLVKHIMDAHAGRIEVESRPGEGSSFRLVFPAPPAAEIPPGR